MSILCWVVFVLVPQFKLVCCVCRNVCVYMDVLFVLMCCVSFRASCVCVCVCALCLVVCLCVFCVLSVLVSLCVFGHGSCVGVCVCV